MTSMRVDGDKSAKVWARRLASVLDDMEKDGVAIGCESIIRLHKGGDRESVAVDSEIASRL